jgi:hypothetical protein
VIQDLVTVAALHSAGMLFTCRKQHAEQPCLVQFFYGAGNVCLVDTASHLTERALVRITDTPAACVMPECSQYTLGLAAFNHWNSSCRNNGVVAAVNHHCQPPTHNGVQPQQVVQVVLVVVVWSAIISSYLRQVAKALHGADELSFYSLRVPCTYG